ncbi:MAG: amino acid ABC transporter substrate-binding protein [SAR324 cluster bacterium]|nr:amino acid ABC transporter substrate-binding protein [SAR324 cluster bacterium]
MNGLRVRAVRLGKYFLCAIAIVAFTVPAVHAQKPLKIGFSMALTGPLAQAGKGALLAMQIWAKDVNDGGGLLGRPVELVYYDDQTKGANVPLIYAKLLDIDKVDFIVSGYGTNITAPAMPLVIDREMVFISLFATAVNQHFNYPYYFQIMPAGPNPVVDWSAGFFEVAARQNPKPKTVALLAADAEFAQNAVDGARENALKHGFEIVYDQSYQMGIPDFTPIVRAIKARKPDIVYVMSYPPGSVGFVRAAKEVRLEPKIIGGSMVGLQYTSIQMNLGPTLNGIFNYWFWAPEPTLNFPGIEAFLKKYQAEAPKQNLDPLGYYLPPFAYAYLQVLQQAIEATKSTDQKTVGEYIRQAEFETVVGKVKFGPNGEWARSRMLFVQLQGIESHEMVEFTKPGKMRVIYPEKFRSGELIYPFPGWQ